MTRFIFAAALVAFFTVPAHADDAFAAANQQYVTGDFAKAAETYEELAKWGPGRSAPLFYNLGNTYFHLHDFGRAILNYERALSLEPNHPEAQTNLSVARDEAHALELAPTWRDSFVHFARPNQYAIGACVLFWIGAILLAIIGGRRPRRPLLTFLGLLCLGATALLVFLVYAIENGPRGARLAIVSRGETEARLATADTAANVLTLPPGSELKIEEQRGEWAYAFLPNGMHGWVPLRTIDFVRL
jgi:tetratricopeptide (TPR) repeat protein